MALFPISYERKYLLVNERYLVFPFLGLNPPCRATSAEKFSSKSCLNACTVVVLGGCPLGTDRTVVAHSVI
jgi:hypothetical protein